MSIDDLDPARLYHLATPTEWADYEQRGTIDPASIAAEGFVHCSWGRQVERTVAKHFAGVPEVLALELDPTKLGGLEVVEEDSYGSGMAFPHIHAAVPATAVVSTTSVA